MGLRECHRCDCCGQDNQTIQHVLGECTCPQLVEARRMQDGDVFDFDQLNCNELPEALKFRVPPALAASVHGFDLEWGQIGLHNNKHKVV